MKRSILVVDDEKYIREGLASALELDGYNGMQAESAEQAWSIINSEPVDMVITDLRMPGMGGAELLRKIYTTYPTIPVVVLTGHGTIEDAVAAMQNGAVDFLTIIFLFLSSALSPPGTWPARTASSWPNSRTSRGRTAIPAS